MIKGYIYTHMHLYIHI